MCSHALHHLLAAWTLSHATPAPQENTAIETDKDLYLLDRLINSQSVLQAFGKLLGIYFTRVYPRRC